MLYCFVGFSQSEQYFFLLEELPKEVKKYTLNANKEYKIDKNIEIFNWYSIQYDQLILISILPDLDTNSNWEEIPYKIIENKIVNNYSLFEKIQKNCKNKFFNQYNAVKKENHKYYVAKNTLIEYFQIVNYKTDLNISGNNIINTKQNFKSYTDVKKSFSAIFNYNPMETNSWDTAGETYIESKFRFIYLSKIEENGKEKIYRFWTFDDWQKPYNESKNPESYNYHRGIDRFAYIEKKGIVGGSYDFYFKKTPQNYIREVGKNIMWAKELFPEK